MFIRNQYNTLNPSFGFLQLYIFPENALQIAITTQQILKIPSVILYIIKSIFKLTTQTNT